MTEAVVLQAQVDEPLPPAGRILQAIEERPALSIKEIADHVALSRSAVRYHIDHLVADGLVTIHRQGNHRLHFAVTVPRMRRRALSLLRVASLRSIVDAVLQPGSESIIRDSLGPTILFRTGAVADETGISVRSVYRGVKVLERAGLAETASTAPRGACVLSIHPELRIAWVFFAKNAALAPRPLRAAPAWLLFFELLVGKMAIGGWAAS